MIAISLLALSSQTVSYNIHALVKNRRGRKLYVLKGNEQLKTPVKKTKLITEIVLQGISNPDSFVIVVEDRGRRFEYPVPVILEPDPVIASDSEMTVKVSIPGMRVSDFEDARFYIIRMATDSSSEAFPLIDTTGENVLVGTIPVRLEPGFYKIAVVLNDRERDLELRIYRMLNVAFSMKYEFSSAPSGFVGFPIHYCLSIEEGPSEISEVDARVDVQTPSGFSFEVALIQVPNKGNIYCGPYNNADIPGEYRATLDGYVSAIVDGVPMRSPLKGEATDEVLLKYEGYSLPLDKGVKYEKQYRGQIFISNPLGEPVSLKILGVQVNDPLALEITADIGKEIMVDGKTPVDIYITLRKGANRDGVYPFMLLFQDTMRGKRYFLPLKLYLGKSGWELLKGEKKGK